ncbi:MAG: thymidine kinase [Acidobacteria bacterium ACB1]|nr:Thymidine kinase [Pyrinomonadaceae bacterium]MCE7962161.1 thymidine kinase [Acidobacteria bacterium ACB1]RIJ92727.1 MAG: thymidine kinase [Acidobacteriota bacterium]
MVEEFAFDNSEERRKARANGTGWIEVIVGSMFSGKSEELIRRLNRARIARQKVLVFKPQIDARYSKQEIASHSGQTHDSIPVTTTAEMLSHIADDTQVVGIDEGQFFDLEIIDAVNKLASEGKRVIIAGLDQDFMGKPFEPMPQLLSIAEFITKTHAICVKCGSTANYSQRTVDSDARVEVGAADKYEARCRKCFIPHSDAPTLHNTV